MSKFKYSVEENLTKPLRKLREKKAEPLQNHPRCIKCDCWTDRCKCDNND